MIRTLLALIVVPALLLLAWLALNRPEPRADFVAAIEEPRFIDPQRASWLVEFQVAGALYEGLTRLDPRTLQPEPAVAQSWRVDESGREYEFTLRPEARWSNGDPVTAEDFRFAWITLLEKETEAQYASLAWVIRGAREYQKSRADDDPTNDLPPESVGVAALDERTLHVSLVAPCPYFLELTAFLTLAPLHRPSVQRFADARGVIPREKRYLLTRTENLVGNGPFRLVDRQFKRRLWLERNEHYWDARHVALNTLEFYIAGDPNVQLIAYETGRVDWVRGLPSPVMQKLMEAARAGHPRPDVHIGDRFAVMFLRVNCRRAPFAGNPRLRQALSLTVNREELCDQVFGVGEHPSLTHVPAGSGALMARQTADGRTITYEPPPGLGAGMSYRARCELARKLLAESGYRDERPIEIMYATDVRDWQRLAEALQATWQRELGIRVALGPVESKVVSSRVGKLDFDLVRSDWWGDYLDPSTFLDMFTSDGGQNRTGWSNAEYDRLINAAALEPDNEKRYALFREAETILCEQELPIIPLLVKRGAFLLRSDFVGLEDNVRDIAPLHRVRRATRP